MRVKCRSKDGKVEPLVPINQRDLGMRREQAVVSHLSRSLRTADKSAARRNIVSVKVGEGVSARRSDRRLGRQVLGNVRDANVQDARSQPQRSQGSAAREHAKGRTP